MEPDHLPPPAAPTADNQQSLPTSERLEHLVSDWATSMLQQSTEDNLYPQLMRMVERPLFAAALKHFGQCQAAAKKLGMHRTTLSKKMEELGLENE